jgi:hypothetical protein
LKRVIASTITPMVTADRWVYKEQVVFQQSPWPGKGFIKTAAISRQDWEDLGSPTKVVVTVESA